MFVRGEIPPEHQHLVVAAFEDLGVAARVWVDRTHHGLGDVQCLVLARLHLEAVLGGGGADVAEDAHAGLKRLVDRVFADQPESARPSRNLLLGGDSLVNMIAFGSARRQPSSRGSGYHGQ